ncbi:MAG: nucleotidyltransferase domain-containing protein [Promethearchaeota archaeon]
MEFLRLVKEKINIEKAILFGSRARGNFLKKSDYDLIIVSRDFKDVFFTKRIAILQALWPFYPIDLDLICYTPEEFNEKAKEIGTIRNAIRDGIVYY